MATVYAIQSYSGTLTASTAQLVQFTSTGASGGIPIRYAYVYVENTGSGTIFARTDGNAATVGGDDTIEIGAGLGQLVANSSALWTQSANVIPKSSILGNGPTDQEHHTLQVLPMVVLCMAD